MDAGRERPASKLQRDPLTRRSTVDRARELGAAAAARRARSPPRGGLRRLVDRSEDGCRLSMGEREFTQLVETIGQHCRLFEAERKVAQRIERGDDPSCIATLYALSHLAFRFEEAAVLSDRFHQLREFALSHREAAAILAAID